MTTDKKTLSFGHYLQAIRIEKGINLDLISSETRISKDTLLLIEKEAHVQLPAEVYVKGFLKSYAKVVGADGIEVVRRYIACRDVLRGATISEADLAKPGLNFWLRLFLALSSLLCLSVLSILLLSYVRPSAPELIQVEQVKDVAEVRIPVEEEVKQEQKKPEAAIAPVPDLVEKVVPEIEETENSRTVLLIDPLKDRQTEQPVSELLLVILTVEDTWIRIFIDDKTPREYSLQPGDRLSLKALSGFNLQIGNATGVNLTLNGKPFEVAGKRGEVVSIRMP